ncbi:MAG TPA: hypothetical protein V6D30_04540 [Leptolyngbyaceae cyanobacterium]
MDYFKEAKYILELLYFHYCGNRYQGHGIMTWNPDEGFHLEAFLDKQGKALPRIELGKFGLIRKSNICSIRMRPQGYDWAIAPNVIISDSNELDISHNRLSIDFGRVIFCQSILPIVDNSLWIGSALYETKSNLPLPDTVHTEIQINEQPIGTTSRASGIFYEDNRQQKVIGNLVDKKQLKLYWQLPKSHWSKAESWRWAMAIQDALSIGYGKTIWLLQREVSRSSKKCFEVRQKVKVDSLGHLSPFGNQGLNKQAFIDLTEFFARNSSYTDICRRIFWQMVEASRQQSWQASELLLSTILEAALRSIDQRPFTPKNDNSWNVGKGLENFFNQYLPSSKWSDIRKQVMKAHIYLRDRNAHPDWLFSQGGRLSEAEQVQSLDSMILLSRFYGYMILALAGFKNLDPIFPAPHKTWGAAATVTRVEENSPNVFPNLFQWKQQVDPIERLPEQLSKAQTYHEKTMLRRNFDRKRATQLQQESEQSIDNEFEAVADQLADEFAACVGANAPVLSDYAVSRASIYEDHP